MREAAAIALRGGLASGRALGEWWAHHCVLEGKSSEGSESRGFLASPEAYGVGFLLNQKLKSMVRFLMAVFLTMGEYDCMYPLYLERSQIQAVSTSAQPRLTRFFFTL